MARVVSETSHGDGLVLVDPAEGDLLPGDHDDAAVGGTALHPDRFGRGAWRWPGWAGTAEALDLFRA